MRPGISSRLGWRFLPKPYCGGMTSLPSERSLHTFVDALAYNPVLGWSHSLGACLLKVSETCSDW